MTVTEWTGLATSNVFDVDGGAAELVNDFETPGGII
jgi:hypothetical protein